MRRRAPILIPLLAAVVLLLYLRPWQPRPGAEPAGPQLPGETAAPQAILGPGPLAPAPGEPDPSSIQPAPRSAKAVQEPPEPAAPAAQDGPQPAAADPAAEYRARYSGWTGEQIADAAKGLEQQVAAERQRLLQERFQRGQFVVVRPGDPPPKIDLGPNGEQPESMGMAQTSPGGATESQITWLPFADYPAFYAQLSELKWLQKQGK